MILQKQWFLTFGNKLPILDETSYKLPTTHQISSKKSTKIDSDLFKKSRKFLASKCSKNFKTT